MKLESKYDVNDKIWYFNDGDHNFYEGTIANIPSWDKYNGFRYEIARGTGENRSIYDIDESKLFTSKKEILEKCFIDEK